VDSNAAEDGEGFEEADVGFGKAMLGFLCREGGEKPVGKVFLAN